MEYIVMKEKMEYWRYLYRLEHRNKTELLKACKAIANADTPETIEAAYTLIRAAIVAAEEAKP